jgi:hypothetical protein
MILHLKPGISFYGLLVLILQKMSIVMISALRSLNLKMKKPLPGDNAGVSSFFFFFFFFFKKNLKKKKKKKKK